jgi:hypothetical protein
MRLSAAVYAWDFPTLKEVLRRFFADVAYMVELLLGYAFGVFIKYMFIKDYMFIRTRIDLARIYVLFLSTANN